MVQITASKEGRPLGDVMADIRAALDQMQWPADAVVVIGGNAEEQQKSFGYLTLAFLAALILVYMVMASQFESLLEPFVIIFSVPLAVVGVALLLRLTRTTLTLTAVVGLVMLAGVVVNNAIVLIAGSPARRRERRAGSSSVPASRAAGGADHPAGAD